MSTNPTNEHREQAREIDLSPCPFCGGQAKWFSHFGSPYYTIACSHCGADKEDDSLANAAAKWNTRILSSRDTEVTQVLEGLSDDGCYDACFLRWMKQHEDSNGFEHSEACLAATALYTKLQPKQ